MKESVHYCWKKQYIQNTDIHNPGGIRTGKPQQTYALDCKATGNGSRLYL
jgi:hypothetical protein